MPLIPQITIKQFKDGRQVARFRDNQGLVRTSTGPVNWVKAADIRTLAQYGISLQIEQARNQIGSDGSPMPPLKGGGGRALFVARVNGRATFQYQGYAAWKAAHGLQPVRDLYGKGVNGHMLDDIRINYIDDKQAQISITRLSSRQKAKGNENRAPWWGWNPSSVRKMVEMAGLLFPQSIADVLFSYGIIGANALSRSGRFFRRVA
jgi:hypothetical protein